MVTNLPPALFLDVWGITWCVSDSHSVFPPPPLSLLGTPYDPYKALWFERKKDPVTKELTHVYRGGYWECKEKQDWTSCPDIF